jgi:hypothetical protein
MERNKDKDTLVKKDDSSERKKLSEKVVRELKRINASEGSE